MIHLVKQEMNITERDPSYFNPYRNAIHAGYQREDTVKKKKPVKKEKRKKGPQIAKIELWWAVLAAKGFFWPVPKSPH